VALATLILDTEAVLAVMAGAAGLAILHVAHGRFHLAGLIGEQFGVAVGTLVHAQMEFMGKFGFAAVVLEGDGGGLQSFVALAAVAARGKGVLAVMAGTAGLALDHVIHGVTIDTSFKSKGLGVAVGALVHFGVELVAESGIARLDLECDIFRRHPLVTAAAVASHGEGLLVVVASAAGTAFFHFGHGYAAGLAGKGLIAVAAAAFAAGFGDVYFMTEYCIGGAFELAVGNGPGLSFMTADARFFIGNSESFHAGMAGTA